MKILKIISSIIVTSLLIALSLYTDAFKKIPIPFQIIIITLLGTSQVLTLKIIDYLQFSTENIKLKKANKSLLEKYNTSQENLSEIQEILVNFLEHSEFYRKKIKEKLKFAEDYLCIVKSSEGFGDVYEELDEHKMLPFTTVLDRIEGSVRPFERIGFFLLPLNSLPGLTTANINDYIKAKIIPLVKRERVLYLSKLPKQIAKKADEFSYKYIAFMIKKDSIYFDVENRKFNRKFNSFMIGNQTETVLSEIQSDLSDFIKTKNFLQIVEWSAFVKLNTERKQLLEKYKIKVIELLSNINIVSIYDISVMDCDKLAKILKQSFGQKIKKTQSLLFAKKIIEDTKKTVEVLRKNKVQI